MSNTTVKLLEGIDTIEFWRSLCPEMTISTNIDDTDVVYVSVVLEDLKEKSATLKKDGYFRWEGLFPQEEMTLLSQAVTLVADATSLPVFALVYDEFWSLLLRLRPIFAAILGNEYQLLPDSWIWRLLPDSEASGWRPHRDRPPGTVLPDGTPQSLSLWIPLTDATPSNGCIYILPASLDSRYYTYGDTKQETVVQWQDILALPAKAGSVLCWTSQLFHWGGRSSSHASQPRISVAFELQSGAIPSQSSFVLEPHQLPSFRTRLALIARQLLQYQHMVSIPAELSRWCQQQKKRRPGQRSFASVMQNLGAG